MTQIRYTLQEMFKIRDAWNALHKLEFLNDFLSISTQQKIAQEINKMLEIAERG